MYTLILLVTIGWACSNSDLNIPDTNPDQNSKDTTDMASDSTLTKDTTSTMNDSSLTYLALGDSYTIGESVNQSERWPVQLVTRLQADSVDIQSPKIIARTGWTTDELQNGIDAAKIDQTYDFVSLLIGVNNQYRNYDIKQYIKEFEELLKQSIAFADNDKTRVFVVSIPDYGVTPFGMNRDPEQIGKEIDEYNAIAKDFADQYGVQYFNITEISRKAKEDPELVAGDGLHPSGKMYSEWVDLIEPWVINAINQ